MPYYVWYRNLCTEHTTTMYNQTIHIQFPYWHMASFANPTTLHNEYAQPLYYARIRHDITPNVSGKLRKVLLFFCLRILAWVPDYLLLVLAICICYAFEILFSEIHFSHAIFAVSLITIRRSQCLRYTLFSALLQAHFCMANGWHFCYCVFHICSLCTSLPEPFLWYLCLLPPLCIAIVLRCFVQEWEDVERKWIVRQ